MATVTTGMNGDKASVVLIAKHEQFDITEHLDPSSARRLGVQLLSAAGRAERADSRPDWP
ncbi:hypothetical protein ASF89_08805 [Frigoribacterium sp. Leaf172]|jgi:hypothetical protein|nr:hypothetical protein ASF89_08805 [Frigoribacterium sp. Leaf172]